MRARVFGMLTWGALVAAVACGPVSVPRPPVVPPQPPVVAPPPAPWHVDVVAVDDQGAPVAGARIELHLPDGYQAQAANRDGYTLWTVPAGFADSDTNVTAEGFIPVVGQHIDVQATHDGGGHNRVTLKRADVDPSSIPLAELARVRGAMWPRVCPGLDLPYGPRPHSPTNIIGTPYLDNYTTDQQEAIAACILSQGYTHVVVGGLVDTWAYHGLWQGHDYSTPEGWVAFKRQLQWWWNHGLRPVVFIHVDGESFEQTRARVLPLLANDAEAARLIRIVTMPGWEPARYEWSSCTWAQYIALAHTLLPNALNLLHTVSDTDAPVGTDALCDDNGKPNGQGWARVVAAGLHGWLIQNGPYDDGPTGDQRTKEFAAQFMAAGDGATYHSAMWHFANGIDFWPRGSAWGPDVPICLYAAEQTAYPATWKDRPPESARKALGDLAVQSGACGYLDGGNVDVPRRR